MKRWETTFMIFLMIGVAIGLAGYVTTEQSEPIGVFGELWLEEDSILDANSVRLAWGVRAPVEKRPDSWKFQIHLRANGSVWIRSFWFETNQVIYERYGSTLDDRASINVDEKTSRMEWVWYLHNPSSTAVRLHEVSVHYSAVHYPFRTPGIFATVVGGIIIAFAFLRYLQNRSRCAGGS